MWTKLKWESEPTWAVSGFGKPRKEVRSEGSLLFFYQNNSLGGLTAEGFLLPPGQKENKNKTNKNPRARVVSPFLQGAVEGILQYALHLLHFMFVLFRSSSAPEVDPGWWAGSGMTATPGTCWWSHDFKLSSRTTCPQPSLTGGTWGRWMQDSSMRTTAWCL